jgi:hypothetical protein
LAASSSPGGGFLIERKVDLLLAERSTLLLLQVFDQSGFGFVHTALRAK